MNFVVELFGKFISSENPDPTDSNINVNKLNADDEPAVTVKTSEANNYRGRLSTMKDGFNSIIASLRSSASDHPRLLDIFDGSLDALRHRRSSTSVAESIKELRERNGTHERCIGSYGFVIPGRKRAETCETMRRRMPGCDVWKSEKEEKTTSLRSRAINNLNARRESNVSVSTSTLNSDGSLVDEKRGQDSKTVEPSLNEIDDHDTISSCMETNEPGPSFMNKIRNNLRNLERNIVLRHRRYNKRAKRRHLSDYYRNKYNTDASESLHALRLKEEETVNNGKSKGVARLFDFVRNKCTARCKTRMDAVRERVASKMEKRKQLFKGQSREQIVAHIRRKYRRES